MVSLPPRVDWLILPLGLGLGVLLAAQVNGFWYCGTYLVLSVCTLVLLHIRWTRTGGLGKQVAERSRSSIWRLPLCWTATFVGVQIPFGRWGFETFSTFTLWTWLNMFVYFSLSSMITAFQTQKGAKRNQPQAMLLWFEILYGMAWLVDLMYWLFLVPHAAVQGGDAFERATSWLNIYLHGFNAVLMNVELTSLSCGVNVWHSIFGIYFGVVYILFNWVVYEVRGTWTYFFLDYNIKNAIPFLLLLQVVVVVSFGLGALISKCLDRVYGRQLSAADPESKVTDEQFRGVEMGSKTIIGA